MDLVKRVRTALEGVEDPELPVSVLDMGLIYDVRASRDGVVEIDMTFTALGCPAKSMLKGDVEEAAASVDGVEAVHVNVVWDPPWTASRLSERAREELRTAGLAL